MNEPLPRGRRIGYRPAFTILELLVVICIIAILLALTIPSFLRVGETGKRHKAVETAKGLELAFNAYYHQNSGWPSNGGGAEEVRGALLNAIAPIYELGTNTVETFKDPWGVHYYLVAFDQNFDNEITPAEGAPGGLTIRKSVIVWNLRDYTNFGQAIVVTNKSWE
jgi:prepilin-type N-terminal cleavage/methylation domain-containing protein